MSQDPQIKPEVVNDINIKFVSAVGYDSHEVHFKTRRTTRFSILQGAFAIFVKKDVNTFRFSYDGTQINGHDTPGSLDTEDNGVFFFMCLFLRTSRSDWLSTGTIDVMILQISYSISVLLTRIVSDLRPSG
ncbi:ubiquitin-like protein [Lactarius sanguifluus]|nr:ubiquitin-like protein [Lactarius sanguifluus]